MASAAFSLPLTTIPPPPPPPPPNLSRASNGGKFLDENPSITVSHLSNMDFRKNRTFNSSITVRSQLNNSPLVSPDDHWGVWAALFATGTFGLWSEKTKIGSMVSAALVSILVGLAASNRGIIPHDAIAAV